MKLAKLTLGLRSGTERERERALERFISPERERERRAWKFPRARAWAPSVCITDYKCSTGLIEVLL